MSVIDLAAARAERTPHTSGEAVCLACQHRWQAAAPSGTFEFECPSCHLMRGMYAGNCWREGDKHWTCNCGNQLFHICTEGTYCPRCGSWQTGFKE